MTCQVGLLDIYIRPPKLEIEATLVDNRKDFIVDENLDIVFSL